MVILKKPIEGVKEKPDLQNYEPEAADKKLFDYFNTGRGYEFTVWADGRKAQAEFILPHSQQYNTLEDGTKYAYLEKGIAIISSSASLTAPVHELLHGFYNQTIWKKGPLKNRRLSPSHRISHKTK